MRRWKVGEVEPFLMPFPAVQLWVVCSCPQCHEKELFPWGPVLGSQEPSVPLTLGSSWGFLDIFLSFHISSNLMSFVLLPSFTVHPCLHASICQEVSPAHSWLVHLWGHFPLNKTSWGQYSGTHSPGLYTLVPFCPPLPTTFSSPSFLPFLSPSLFLLRSFFPILCRVILCIV